MLPNIILFGQEIPSYSLMIMVGYLVGLIIVIQRAHINSLSKNDAFVAYIMAGFGALMGGKIFFMIQGIGNPLYAQYNFFEYFAVAGLVYYGAFFGVIAMLILFSKLFKKSIWSVTDALLPVLPLAQAFGRVGCFLVGCCYGRPSELGFYMNPAGLAPHDEKLLPIQLFEAGACLILFFIMIYIGRKPKPRGLIPGIYCLGYGMIRFINEFFRGDAIRGIYGGLSTSQWISSVLIAIGCFLVFYYSKKQKYTSTSTA